MGWLISVAMLVIGCFGHNDILVETSGLFAIAGAITSTAQMVCNKSQNGETE